MSIFDPDLYGRTKHALAIARIRNFCAGKRTLVAFSGGKDSQCCYHLCEEAGVPFTAQYSITRFEPPELVRFVREAYPGVTFRRAYKRTLCRDIEANGLPTRWSRWCCDAKHKATPGFDIAVVGVRAAESSKRAKTWREFGFKPDHTAYVCPIIDWTTEDVWEYLAHKGVPHCAIYDEGYKRIGCVCCPLAPKLSQQEAARWPKTAAMLKYGASLFVARMRARGWMSERGNICGDWRLAKDPVEELFHRWIVSGQTTMSVEFFQERERERKRAGKPEDAPCLFAGTGFSESDGRNEE